METTSQRFLSAAIKLSRPPKDCVVFESSPLGVTAAHNCSCKAGPPSWHRLGRVHVQGILLVSHGPFMLSKMGSTSAYQWLCSERHLRFEVE